MISMLVGWLSERWEVDSIPSNHKMLAGESRCGSEIRPAGKTLILTASKNFPYATIEPEEARVLVPDARYDWLCEQYSPKSRVPANLTVYDIAGLTRGASTGAGLGNAFLSHIRAVDAIFQVVRCFDDAEIIHVEGDVDPIRDLDIISEELRIKDIEFVEKALENLKKQTRRGGQSLEMKKLKEEEATVEKVLAWLKDGKDVRKENWSPKEVSLPENLLLKARILRDEQELQSSI